VLKAKEQVVAGKLYHLTVEATDAGNNKMYEVKVWVKPWMNFKQLQEFKHVEGGTSSDLGVKPGNGSFLYIYRYKQLIVFLFFPVDGCNENGIGV